MKFDAIDLEGIRSMLIELLLKENSSTAVNLWFGDLKLASIDENEAVFVSPTDLKKKIIQQRFAISMADHLNQILGFEPSVVIHSSEHGEIASGIPPAFIIEFVYASLSDTSSEPSSYCVVISTLGLYMQNILPKVDILHYMRYQIAVTRKSFTYAM